MDYRQIAAKVKDDSYTLATLSEDMRNAALDRIAVALEEEKEAIFSANARDMAVADQLPGPIIARLKFDEQKLADCIQGIRDLIALPDPLFHTLLKRKLDEDLILTKQTCPIGVIGVIFESRPDALVQISALCIKSGNGALLKGGSEARHTNRTLFDVIHEAAFHAGLPEHFAFLVEDRTAIDELLTCDDSIDLIIPRGSNAFVQHIMNHSRIPVMGHADGICHVYVDRSADLDQACSIVLDSKTQYVAACNAAETLLVHRDVAEDFLPRLENAIVRWSAEHDDQKVELITAPDSSSDYPEYLDYKMTVKVVDSLEQAIDHINRYGSHHTDCIVTEDDDATDRFLRFVDSAGVYRNCSTRFADGFRYGFGAEVGISTGKLHARGPVGLDGLVTYKYQLEGAGHIVADYATGNRQFHFEDL